MPDYYQEVEQVGWLDKLGNSCLGAILGLVLFLGSFVLLVWNEGKINVATVAQSSIDISAIVNSSTAQSKLVSVTGRVTTKAPLGDDRFLLPGQYVVADRTVEMYAWHEKKDTETHKKVGGSETKVTTYTYETRWSTNPENSRNFKYSQNHQNPPKAFPDQLFKVTEARVGRYALDMNGFNRINGRRSSCDGTGSVLEWGHGGTINIPKSGYLQLTTQNSRVRGRGLHTNGYIFQGNGLPKSPQVGDIRVCYSVLPVKTEVTVFGKLDRSQITPFLYRQTPIYRLLPGTREAAIATLTDEHKLWTWIFRGGGFLMMWVGLVLMGSPLSTFLDVIPFVGSIAEALTGVASLVAAFVLSSVTILTAMLLNHPIALFLSIGVTIGVLLMFRRRK